MLRLLSTKDRRQLSLLNLYQQNENLNLTYKELSERLDCTRSTIIRDLNEIQEIFPNELVVTESGSLINIGLNRTTTDKYYFRKYSEKATTFRLLFALIREKYRSIEEFSEGIFVSRSSTYRAIKQINQFFEESKIPLQITTSPLELRGDELMIRLIYPYILHHYDDISVWPFKDISQQEAIELFEIMSANSPYLKNFTSNPLLYLQVGLNYERFVNGYPLMKEDWTIGNKDLSVILSGQDPFDEVEIHGRVFSLFELIPQLAPGIIYEGTLLNRSMLEKNKMIPDQVKNAIVEFEQDMFKLKDKYELQAATQKDIEMISLTIYNLCVSENENMKFIIDDPIGHQSNLVHEVAVINPQYILDVRAIIQDFCEKLNVNPEIYTERIEFLLFYYIIIWPDTILELNKIVKIDLLLYTGNYQYDLEYKAILDPIVYSYVTVHVQNRPIDWEQVLKSREYEIIMTSYDIPETQGIHTFNIQSMPNVETFLWIYQTVRLINDSDTSMLSNMVLTK